MGFRHHRGVLHLRRTVNGIHREARKMGAERNDRMDKIANDVFTQRHQEMMTTKDLEKATTPDLDPFFPAVGNNLTLGSARRGTFKLYGEQFLDSFSQKCYLQQVVHLGPKV